MPQLVRRFNSLKCTADGRERTLVLKNTGPTQPLAFHLQDAHGPGVRQGTIEPGATIPLQYIVAGAQFLLRIAPSRHDLEEATPYQVAIPEVVTSSGENKGTNGAEKSLAELHNCQDGGYEGISQSRRLSWQSTDHSIELHNLLNLPLSYDLFDAEEGQHYKGQIGPRETKTIPGLSSNAECLVHVGHNSGARVIVRKPIVIVTRPAPRKAIAWQTAAKAARPVVYDESWKPYVDPSVSNGEVSSVGYILELAQPAGPGSARASWDGPAKNIKIDVTARPAGQTAYGPADRVEVIIAPTGNSISFQNLVPLHDYHVKITETKGRNTGPLAQLEFSTPEKPEVRLKKPAATAVTKPVITKIFRQRGRLIIHLNREITVAWVKIGEALDYYQRHNIQDGVLVIKRPPVLTQGRNHPVSVGLEGAKREDPFTWSEQFPYSEPKKQIAQAQPKAAPAAAQPKVAKPKRGGPTAAEKRAGAARRQELQLTQAARVAAQARLVAEQEAAKAKAEQLATAAAKEAEAAEQAARAEARRILAERQKEANRRATNTPINYQAWFPVGKLTPVVLAVLAVPGITVDQAEKAVREKLFPRGHRLEQKFKPKHRKALLALVAKHFRK